MNLTALTTALISTTIATAVAHGSTFTTIDCLSASNTADLTLQIKDAKTTDYVRLYSSLRGRSSDIAKGTIKEFTAKKFVYETKTENQPLVIEIDFQSTQVENGILTIAGKSQPVQCFNSDVAVED